MQTEHVRKFNTIKILYKLGVQGICLNIINIICDSPTANIILNSEKVKAYPLRTRQEAYSHNLHSAEYWKSQSEQLGKKKEIERYLYWKK